MPDLREDFLERLARIEAHALQPKPRRRGWFGRRRDRSLDRSRVRVRLPWRGPAFVLLLALIVKALLMNSAGDANYDGLVRNFLAGNWIERRIGWLLQRDPVTTVLAAGLDTFLEFETQAVRGGGGDAARFVAAPGAD